MEATVADENGAEARAPEQMDLDCGPFTVAVDDWVQHARAQLAAGEDAQLTPADFQAKAALHAVFAFGMKEQLTDDDWRCIFVVRDGAQVHLFDHDGIDLVDESAPMGRQQLVVADAETGFLEEWGNGYYTNSPSELQTLLPALEEEKEVEKETQHGAPVPMHCPCLAQHFPSSFRSSLAGAVTVDTVAALGARVAVFMADIKWYGGFVESIEADGNRLIVFDDGDIREVEPSKIQEMLDARPTPLFKAANASDGGLVANVPGLLMAARLLRVGNNIIGAFVGATDVTIGGEIMYEAFILRSGVIFPPPARVRRGQDAPSQQERGGFHTFRRGDAVEYLFGDDAGPDEQCSAKATVFGVVEGRTNQGPEKALVLRCSTTQLFFLSRWPRWRRMPQPFVALAGVGVEFEPDNDAHVITMFAEDSAQMISDFQEAKSFERLDDYNKVHSCRASALPL